MSSTMWLKAKPGLKVAREDASRRYLPENEPMEVPATAYYLRRLADGDVIQVDPPKKAKE